MRQLDSAKPGDGAIVPLKPEDPATVPNGHAQAVKSEIAKHAKGNATEHSSGHPNYGKDGSNAKGGFNGNGGSIA